MAQVGIKELLEAGVHFGHQTRRWNPKMRRFIHGENGGIYVIDLLKTEQLLRQAQEFSSQIAHKGGTVLFVGTKKQARDAVKEAAEKSGMPYVNHRWLGGLLTNFQTINQRIKRLHDLERYETDGQLALLPTRERMAAIADLTKLRANLGGVKNMTRPPNAMVVIDLKVEEIAVREAQRLRIPIIGLVDTNCDPDGIEYVIPGNDDAIRSCALIINAIGDVVGEGSAVFRAQEEQARKEAEEAQRAAAEERARREAEEQEARETAEREAAAAAKAAAEAAAATPAAPAPAEAPPSAPAPAAPAPAEAAPKPAPDAPAPAKAKAKAKPAAPRKETAAPEAPAADAGEAPAKPRAKAKPKPKAAAPAKEAAAPEAPAPEAAPGESAAGEAATETTAPEPAAATDSKTEDVT